MLRLSGADFSAEQLGAVLNVAQMTGLVVIYSSDTAASVTAPAGVTRLDLAGMNLPADDEAAVRAIVPALQPLRDLSEDPAEAN